MEVMKSKFFVPCNIFILPRNTFSLWARFVFGVLDKFNEKMGFKTDLDITNHVVNNMDKYVENKGGLPNSSTAYQSRIHAFLMERLSSFFFKKYVKNYILAELPTGAEFKCRNHQMYQLPKM